MRVAFAGSLVFALVVVSAMLWQHRRYAGLRRNIAQDRQPAFHSADVFHVFLFLTTAPGADVVEELRAPRLATDGSDPTCICAGKAILSPLRSAQIGQKDWSAVVLLQYPSRAAFDRHAESEEMRRALARFGEVYAQGFQRWPFVSAAIPQVLLAMRTVQIIRGRPSHFPFERSQSREALPEVEAYARRLRAETDLGAHAVLVVNLVKEGTPEQRAADRRYGASMFGAMAEGGYGSLHVGRAVRIERSYDFDRVVLVFYPGVDFFADMVQSEFFQGIHGDKQLADTQAVITVPILDRL